MGMKSQGAYAKETGVGKLLRDKGLSLCVAESCTGGLLAHRITNVPGSSVYFRGGVIAYANEVKEQLLGVRRETLRRFGAVSQETAQEMAACARRLLGTDIALAITGIAGPTGATPQKPVGLTYIALDAEDTKVCHEHVWESDRLGNKERSVDAALDMLQTYLEKKESKTRGRRNLRPPAQKS